MMLSRRQTHQNKNAEISKEEQIALAIEIAQAVAVNQARIIEADRDRVDYPVQV